MAVARLFGVFHAPPLPAFIATHPYTAPIAFVRFVLSDVDPPTLSRDELCMELCHDEGADMAEACAKLALRVASRARQIPAWRWVPLQLLRDVPDVGRVVDTALR